jgi:hypothetical protein
MSWPGGDPSPMAIANGVCPGVPVAHDLHQTTRMARPNAPRTRVRRALSSCVVACALASGCAVAPCDRAIDPNGGRYDVEVTDIAPLSTLRTEGSYSGSGGPCSGVDGIQAGSTLTFQTIGATEVQWPSCRAVIAELSTGPVQLMPPADLTASLAVASEIRSAFFMEAFASVTTTACTGADIFVFFEDGVMSRLFVPSDDAVCPVCNDNFTIQLASS